jgi:hypothetical protein
MTICPKTHFFFSAIYIFKFFITIKLKKKVGKWAENPQTRINTGFFRGQFCFLKVGKNPLFLTKINFSQRLHLQNPK